MSTFQEKSIATSAEKPIVTNGKAPRFMVVTSDLLSFPSNRKISCLDPDNKAPVIIDKIKPLFGLSQVGRDVIISPNFEEKIIESHDGFERPLHISERDIYPVFKIRVFRWIVGLSCSFPLKEIMVRQIMATRIYLSYREEKIEPNRKLRLDCKNFDLSKVCKEMLGKWSSNDLYDSLMKIVLEIDKGFVWFPGYICRFINQYKLI